MSIYRSHVCIIKVHHLKNIRVGITIVVDEWRGNGLNLNSGGLLLRDELDSGGGNNVRVSKSVIGSEHLLLLLGQLNLLGGSGYGSLNGLVLVVLDGRLSQGRNDSGSGNEDTTTTTGLAFLGLGKLAGELCAGLNDLFIKYAPFKPLKRVELLFIKNDLNKFLNDFSKIIKI
jgi:hypothetical protein